MSRVALTDEMAEFIADCIAAPDGDAPAGQRSEALPLLDDPHGVIGIRPDGTLVEWSHDGEGRDARPIEDRTWALIALVAGARRYPRLRELLSARGPGAVVCQCRRIPGSLSGLFWCRECGGLGWVAEGRSCTLGRMAWPRRDALVAEAIVAPIFRAMAVLSRHLIPRRYSLIELVLVGLALASFYGAAIILTGGSRGFVWNGMGLIVLGILSLKVATRGVGRRRPDRPRAARGPSFDADDPEVAALPPTSTTKLSERIRLARERQKRAQD